MSEIVDMLRQSADDVERYPYVDQHFSVTFIRALAEIIDEAMIECQLGADDMPIRPCQTVYMSSPDKSGECFVRSISFDADGPTVYVEREGELTAVMPEWLTHENPDGLGRIADDLDAWCDRVDVDRDACGEPRELARRIRRLASREGCDE